MDHPLRWRIAAVLDLDPDGRAIEYDDRWFSWGQLGAASRGIAEAVGPGAQVGILLRNTPAHVAALLGVLLAGGCVVVINPSRGQDRTKSDIGALDLPVIIGTDTDLEQFAHGTAMRVAIADLDTAPVVRGGPSHAAAPTGVAVRMLTSGTTGPPKRVDLTYDMLAVSVLGGTEFANASAPKAVSAGVAIVNAPLVHIGGVYRVLQCVAEARPFVLLPRFELATWAAAVRRYRPKAVSLVPAALRAVLHSGLDAEDLAGVKAVTSGTAPLSAEDADAFTAKFGIPVLTSYAATEFGGGVAGWTLADHQKYWQAKHGSVGRASLGAQLRVVSENGATLGPDEAGLLEVKPGQLGPDAEWVRTTDLARIDADGFLWILGRADQAIIRGGFKVHPDDVRAVLESHPAVLGAAVVGRTDSRLGEVPVAMIELRAEATTAELTDFLRDRLAPYEIPAELAVVDAIPRTPSGKADLAAVRGHFSQPDTVGRLLVRQAAARGDHPLLICDDERLSYREAEEQSAHLARGLIALGAGKGTHVGVLHPNSAAFVVAMLAAARIGAVVVPFSTFATGSELQEQLIHSDTEILLSASGFRGHDYVARLTDVSAPWLRHAIFDNRITGDSALLPAVEEDVGGCDPLAIIYTSGSTGMPKGAVHTHESLLGHQCNLNEIRGLTADDRLFCNSPFFWIGGFAFGLLATLLAGSTLVCSAATDPADTLDLLERVRPTVTNGFAAGIAHLARHDSFPDRNLSSMRRGNLYPIMAPDARPRDPDLRHNMLGMTEGGGVVLLSGDDTDQPEHRRGSFGKPAPGFETRVVDGELHLRGPYLMQHYHKRSREECFDADGWFHTGDRVRVDDDGFFYFLGRRGSMIKTAGANVSPVEVERAIAAVTGMPAHVLGLPDSERGQIVAAAVVIPDGASLDITALRDALKSELSAYKIPRRLVTIAAGDIPLLSSGKVDIRRLAELFDA